MAMKAIFLDLDGTLNNDEKQITGKTRSALMHAQRQGIRLVLASARPSPGLYKERDILQLQNYGGILMSYNGGRIVDAASGSVEPGILHEVKAKIAALLPRELTVVRTAPFYLEIIPASINKGQGILDTCHALGIRAEETIAFGDAENDIPMLKTAGIGVAMGNASAAVKAAADDITLSNNADGIAKWLEKNVEKMKEHSI